LRTVGGEVMLVLASSERSTPMSSAVGENHAKPKLAAGELVLCMGINQMRTPNIAMIAAACGFDAIYIDLEHNPTSLETAARAAGAHGKWMGVGGVREDLEFQTWLLQLGMRYLTGGSDVGYILSAGRADVKRLREVRLS
jgi:2-keto-3-deoxy-L-rhamnonate aldolase RhmA